MRVLILSPLLLASACATLPPSSTAPTPDVSRPQVQPPVPHGDDAAGDHDAGLRASTPARPAIASPVIVPLDPASLAALPREPITATAAHDHVLRCDGIPLLAVLRASGAMPAEPLRGAHLARYVQVDARDGYRVVYALSELDPTLGNRAVYLADRCDGKPLDADDGPLRLIAPGEARPARWVRQVKSITVIVAP